MDKLWFVHEALRSLRNTERPFPLSLPQIKGKYELHCYVTEELVVDRSDGTIGIGLIDQHGNLDFARGNHTDIDV